MAASADPYVDPETNTFRNKLGIRDPDTLHDAEYDLTRARQRDARDISFPVSADGFRDTHRHIFQDVYEWAGRTAPSP